MSPQSAIERLAAGELAGPDQPAWELFQAAWPLLERFLRVRLVLSKLNANFLEDCGQNILTRVWGMRKGYRGRSEAQFWAWLRRICDNERRRIQTRSARRALVLPVDNDPETEKTLVADDPPASMHAERREAHAALGVALAQLEETRRRLIELLYFPPQLSERAAAELLGWSASQVHKRKHATLRELAVALEHAGIHWDRVFGGDG